MSQNQPKTGQKWLFPVGSGSVFHLAERPTEPLARCGFRPQGTQNGVFWVKINDDSPKAYCPDCGRWLKEHPEPAASAWIPGPPTASGACWLHMPRSLHPIRLGRAIVSPSGALSVSVMEGWLHVTAMRKITHHIPLVKPEAP